MRDLSYLSPKSPSSTEEGAISGNPNIDDAYAQYLLTVRASNPNGIPMSRNEFERFSLGSSWLNNLKDVAKKVVQTCRLMVGIHDYEYYVDHMRRQHPGTEPMSREDFYRYCLEARFPSNADAARGRCPC